MTVNDARIAANQAPPLQDYDAFSTDDAYRALDSLVGLLKAVSSPEAEEVDIQKQELLRVRFEEQARRETRRAAIAPVEGRPAV